MDQVEDKTNDLLPDEFNQKKIDYSLDDVPDLE